MWRLRTTIVALMLLGTVQVAFGASAQAQIPSVCPDETRPTVTACVENTVDDPADHAPDGLWTPQPSDVGTTSCPGGSNGAGVQTGTGQTAACVELVDRSGGSGPSLEADCRPRAGYVDAGATVTAQGRTAGACAYGLYDSGYLGPIPLPPSIHFDVGTCGIAGLDLALSLPFGGFDVCLGIDG